MTTSSTYDRRKELEEFDNTKLGVKGLVDSGITRVPRIFHHSPAPLPKTQQVDPNNDLIPVIDLSGPHPYVVERVREASAKLGFFQVVNHGVPLTLLDRLVGAVRAFHELPPQEKARYYRRAGSVDGINSLAVSFHSNTDLFTSKAAAWRDTLQVLLAPAPLDPNALPQILRDEVIEWNKEVTQLVEKLIGPLCEGLGLSNDRLKGTDYLGRRNMVGQYYPYCPEPEKTMGIASHTDPGLMTVLLQDQIGGLQINHHGKWLDVKPVRGALTINLGDMFQMISNDEYKSGEHRVVANSVRNARVSVAVFFSPGTNESLYGPLPELVSPEKPALYRQFKFSEFLERFLKRDHTEAMTNYFRL